MIGIGPEGPILLITIGAIAIGLAIYFLPTVIAFSRKHNNRIPILLINLFLGWSAIGWLIGLIWSFTKDVEKRE